MGSRCFGAQAHWPNQWRQHRDSGARPPQYSRSIGESVAAQLVASWASQGPCPARPSPFSRPPFRSRCTTRARPAPTSRCCCCPRASATKATASIAHAMLWHRQRREAAARPRPPRRSPSRACRASAGCWAARCAHPFATTFVCQFAHFFVLRVRGFMHSSHVVFVVDWPTLSLGSCSG